MIDSAGSGNVVNYDPSNVIMLTGRASVVERLTEVIQRVDHAGNRTEEVIPLDNASASEIARVLESLTKNSGENQPATLKSQIVADERTNSVIVSGDPDVVMVGEIRDTETAEIAVQASLTGHLVLSTLHTNTAVGAITRLQDMGVEPFLLSSSLTGVMAQRLVRTLCPDCRQPAPATDEEKRLLGITDARTVTLYHPQGCPACNHKGFRGRTAIHELIVVDATLRDLIHRQAGELELERYVRQHSAGIRSNGIEKVLAGETSLDEVLRVTMEA